MDTLLAGLALGLAAAALALIWRVSARVDRVAWTQRRGDLLVSIMEVRDRLRLVMTELEEYATRPLEPLVSGRLERLMERSVSNEQDLTQLRTRLDELGIPDRITAANRAELEKIDYEMRTVHRQTERICEQSREFGEELGDGES